jgi:hypothetical protein
MCGDKAVTIINRIPFCQRHAELVKQNRPVEVVPYKKDKKTHERTIKD